MAALTPLDGRRSHAAGLPSPPPAGLPPLWVGTSVSLLPRAGQGPRQTAGRGPQVRTCAHVTRTKKSVSYTHLRAHETR
eukprot:8445999-Prorocentrum_lima.AAC.1